MLLIKKNTRHLLNEVSFLTYYNVTCESCGSEFAAPDSDMYRNHGIDGRASFQGWSLGKEGQPPPPCEECGGNHTLKVCGGRGAEGRSPRTVVRVRLAGKTTTEIETEQSFLTRSWKEGVDYYLTGAPQPTGRRE